MSDDVAATRNIDWKKMGFLFLGLALFAVVYWSPLWPEAVDPMGKHFPLSTEAKGAIAVFLLAATWWVFEVVPIGVTSLAIGVLQAMFLIRPARDAFTDFMVPSVMFIFASIMIGLVFTKTGLTNRLAYKMLVIVGEKTSMIYLGCFIVTSALTHIMAHTAVAATIYPLLISIYSLYGEGDKKTNNDTSSSSDSAIFRTSRFVCAWSISANRRICFSPIVSSISGKPSRLSASR